MVNIIPTKLCYITSKVISNEAENWFSFYTKLVKGQFSNAIFISSYMYIDDQCTKWRKNDVKFGQIYKILYLDL